MLMKMAHPICLPVHLLMVPYVKYQIKLTKSPLIGCKAEEGEKDDEIKDLVKPGGKKKKNERSAAKIAELVETLMAKLEVVAEEDVVLNTQGKAAINKLRKLPLLTKALSMKQLQHEFLYHGVLTLLKKLAQATS